MFLRSNVMCSCVQVLVLLGVVAAVAADERPAYSYNAPQVQVSVNTNLLSSAVGIKGNIL